MIYKKEETFPDIWSRLELFQAMIYINNAKSLYTEFSENCSSQTWHVKTV